VPNLVENLEATRHSSMSFETKQLSADAVHSLKLTEEAYLQFAAECADPGGTPPYTEDAPPPDVPPAPLAAPVEPVAETVGAPQLPAVAHVIVTPQKVVPTEGRPPPTITAAAAEEAAAEDAATPRPMRQVRPGLPPPVPCRVIHHR